MPKIFSENDKTKIRNAMFEYGFELLKKEGMIHMSVEKITSGCGIGKSTFYNFFNSKEDFILQLIEHKREAVLNSVSKMPGGRDRFTVQEGKELFKGIVNSSDSIYQYLKLEDLLHLQEKQNYLSSPDLIEETSLLKELFSKIEQIRKDPDYPLIANLLKIITLTMEERKMLHEEAFDQTVDALYEALFHQIFEEKDR